MNSNRFASTATAGGASIIGHAKQEHSIPIRKVVKENFRGPAPTDKPLVELYLALPSDKSPLFIDPNDAVIKKALEKIEEKCEVWINIKEGMLLLSGRIMDKVALAIGELRDYQRSQAREIESSATMLVHRMGGAHFSIFLKPAENLGGAGSGLPEGSWRGVAYTDGTKDVPDVRDSQALSKQLLDAIKQTARCIRPDLGQKFVRVYLGLRTMSKKKKAETVGFKGTRAGKKKLGAFEPEACDEYETSRFQTLMDSAINRGHSDFYRCFGGEKLTRNILQHVHRTDDSEMPEMKRFVALDATVERLQDVKPRFCLVFFSAGFRIEMDIRFETAPPSRRAITSANQSAALAKPLVMNLPTAAPPRVFRFNKTVNAEIAVACPDAKVDWQISIESDLSADKVHDEFRALATQLRFDPVPEENLTFPIARISREALLKAHIDGVACKVYRTFECLSGPYHVQIADYYDWSFHPLSKGLENRLIDSYEIDTNGDGARCPVPHKSCAVSLFGDDWDEKMRDMDPASTTFAQELIHLFYHNDLLATHGGQIAGELSAAALLREIEFLLDITTRAATELDSMEDVVLAPLAQDPTQGTNPANDPTQIANDAESLLDFSAQPEDEPRGVDHRSRPGGAQSPEYEEVESLLNFSD